MGSPPVRSGECGKALLAHVYAPREYEDKPLKNVCRHCPADERCDRRVLEGNDAAMFIGTKNEQVVSGGPDLVADVLVVCALLVLFFAAKYLYKLAQESWKNSQLSKTGSVDGLEDAKTELAAAEPTSAFSKLSDRV